LNQFDRNATNRTRISRSATNNCKHSDASFLTSPEKITNKNHEFISVEKYLLGAIIIRTPVQWPEKNRQENAMRRNLFLTAAAISILCAGSFVSIGAQAASHTTTVKSGKVVTMHHHNRATPSDITSFSSSSAPAGLNVGVNHPAKK
jgi:hypothetical protein